MSTEALSGEMSKILEIEEKLLGVASPANGTNVMIY